MNRKWIFFAPFLIALFVLVGGEAVMHLWNWLVPAVFGWRQITFWQAVGLLALCRILFGGVAGRGSHRSGFRGRNSGRWGQMSPEEREKFRQSFRARCGFGAPASESGEQA